MKLSSAKFWTRAILIFVILWFTIFFVFNDQIKETKIYKTKMDVLTTILSSDNAGDAMNDIQTIIDTNYINPAEEIEEN